MDIYDACDVTLTGIMAVRSRENGGATDAILASIASARKLIAAYPDTKPAKAMKEMIALFEPELSANPSALLAGLR